MSSAVHIFIKTSSSLSVLAEEVELVTGIKFVFNVANDRKYSDYFEYNTDSVSVDLIEADGFVNDQDMLFESYQFLLGIMALGNNEHARDNLSELLFEQLKLTQRYALLMTLNMGQKLSQFDP